jgi:hypothetical protein
MAGVDHDCLDFQAEETPQGYFMVMQQRLILLPENGGIGERNVVDDSRFLLEEARPDLLLGKPLGGEKCSVKDHQQESGRDRMGAFSQQAEPDPYPRLSGLADELEVLLEDPPENVLSYSQCPVFGETFHHSAPPEATFIQLSSDLRTIVIR